MRHAKKFAMDITKKFAMDITKKFAMDITKKFAMDITNAKRPPRYTGRASEEAAGPRRHVEEATLARCEPASLRTQELRRT